MKSTKTNEKCAKKIDGKFNDIFQKEEQFITNPKNATIYKSYFNCKQRSTLKEEFNSIGITKYFEISYSKVHDIHIIGDLESFYSNKTVINSYLTEDGFSVHYRYRKIYYNETAEIAKKTFYMDDYGFFSSVAKALHARLRKKISDRLNENDPQAKKIFSAFVPEIGADGEKIQNSLYWNRFILENTLNTEKAKNLSEAIDQYNNKLNNFNIYPYRITPQEIQELEDLQLTCSYDGKVFTSAQVMEIAKSAAEIEHIRWNAYMRSEGFSFIQDFNKTYDQKYYLHVNLTPCEDLNFSDCIKDI